MLTVSKRTCGMGLIEPDPLHAVSAIVAQNDAYKAASVCQRPPLDLDDLAPNRLKFARAQTGDWSHVAQVFVCSREMKQDIANCLDAETP